MSDRGRVLALLGTAFFMTILDGTSLLTALPSITRSLRLGPSSVQWTVTAYALAFSGPLLLCGRLADLLGRRRMFACGMALRVMASALCGLAPSGTILVAGRALQGVSAAIIAPAALSMVVNAFPEGAARNRALGVWGCLGGFGATAGLLLGGLITASFGWPWIFWINVPVGAAVLLLTPFILSESRAPSRSFDILGAVTATPFLVSLVYAIIRAPSGDWPVPVAIAALFAVAFILVERHSEAPLVPFHLLRSKSLISGNLTIVIAGMTVDGMLVTLTSYGQGVLGWSPTHFGLLATAMTATSVAGALASQRLVARWGVRRTATTGMLLLCAACLTLSTRTGYLPALIVFGVGMGAGMVGAQIAALTGTTENVSGLTAALTDMSFAIGTALGVAICTTATTFAGHRAAFLTASIFTAAGVFTTLTLPGLRFVQASAQPASEY